jgi:parallel beta-helix repeat protein
MSLLAGCGGSDSSASSTTVKPTTAKSATLRVPGDQKTIQAAVDAAKPGDLILVAPGTYTEAVTVETDRLTIRGEDRNTVILNGNDTKENGFLVFSDGVVVENLTVHNYRGNGVLFSGDYTAAEGAVLDGFRGSYLTAYNNGLYGVYAFAAKNGIFDHIYGSGNPDAAVYVGQCYPCNTVVTDSVGELNAVGFQGTNAGGDLYVVGNIWRSNRVGVESVSSTKERISPQREATIVANRIENNNGAGAPKATEAYGVGVAISGGQGNRVSRNTISGHTIAGVIVTGAEQFLAENNRVETNTLSTNGTDLVYATSDGAARGNCFAANTFTTSNPSTIEQALPCTGTASGGNGSIPPGTPPPQVDYRTMPAPGPQPTMPDATTAAVNPPKGPPKYPSLDDAKVPA